MRRKIRKNIFSVDGVNTMVYLLRMPNMPDPDKHLVGIRMPRTLHRRLKKMASERGVSLTDVILEILSSATLKIILNSKDYEEIAKETKIAEERYRNR